MGKLKVLLVQPNNTEPNHKIYEYRRYTSPPLGLMYIGAVVREAGHEVKIVDRNIESEEYFDEVLKSFNPDVLGTNAITGYMIIDAIKISKQALALNPKVINVWGGQHPSLFPEQTIREDFIHYLVCGEGEKTFVELLGCIEEGKGAKDVKGIVYKEDGKAVVNPKREFIADLDELPFLPWDLVRAERYMEDGEAYLFTSRGCPYRCQFCYAVNIHQGSWRAMSAERVLEEFKRMNEIKEVKRLKFVDDLFTVDRDRYEKILAGLPSELRLYMEVRVNHVDEKFISAVKRFKDVQLLIGVESASDETLKRVKKGITVEQTRKAFKLLNDNKIATNASAIIGFPWEDYADCKNTAKFLREIKPTIAKLCIFQPFPGTPMFDEFVADGTFKPPASLEEWGIYASTSNAFMNLSKVDQKDLERLRRDNFYVTLWNYVRTGRVWDLYYKIFKYFFKEELFKRKGGSGK
jgi:radical SAM superfamily enzyme YgiQ (UPF0313 family)